MAFNADETFHEGKGAEQPRRMLANVTRQLQGAATRSTLNIHSSAARIEVEDAFFNHNSALMMPDTIMNRASPATERFQAGDPSFMSLLERFHPEVHRAFTADPPSPPGATEEHVGGLVVLAAVYRFLALNPSYRLLLAGHCDRSGEDDYNFKLSALRARNVLFLLRGERDRWVDIAVEHSQVEDQKRICRHAARQREWPCDPGRVDNERDADLQRALSAFRENFNRDFGRSLALDGPADRDTWAAFFDMYMDELASVLDCDVEGLAGHREHLQFVDDEQPLIACGEKLPIEQAERDGYRSEQNRRVEMLFFSKNALPDLHCHSGTFCLRTCAREECGVYSPNLFSFTPLHPTLEPAPRRKRTDGTFKIVDANDDLRELADKPDDGFTLEVRVQDVDASRDPWAFLGPFMDLEPQHGMNETARRTDEGEG